MKLECAATYGYIYRKPITSITAVLLQFVTDLLNLPRTGDGGKLISCILNCTEQISDSCPSDRPDERVGYARYAGSSLMIALH
jgi:hypothetical protein